MQSPNFGTLSRRNIDMDIGGITKIKQKMLNLRNQARKSSSSLVQNFLAEDESPTFSPSVMLEV